MTHRNPIWLSALDSMNRFELDTAEKFLLLSEFNFAREQEKLDREYKKYPKSYWEEDLGPGTKMVDGLADDYTEISDMQRLNRYFGVILIFSALERVLSRIYRDAERLKLIKPSKRILNFKLCVKALKKDLGIDHTLRVAEYRALNKLLAIRNSVAHDMGRVHARSIKKLRQYKFKEHELIELSEKYFFEIKDFVRTECLFIIESYRKIIAGLS
jgi:hypothetical protein